MIRALPERSLTAFVLVAAGVVAVACGERDSGMVHGGGPTAGTTGDAGSDAGSSALTIAFNPMYSAYDGNTHQFKVPVKVTGATGQLTVTTSPPEFVDYSPSTEGVTLTTRRSGKCTVTIQDASGNRGTAELTVTETAPDAVEIGAKRYANGIDFLVPPEGGLPSAGGGPRPFAEAGTLLPEGGFPFPPLEAGTGLPEAGVGPVARPMGGTMENRESACTFCHVPEGAPAENPNMSYIDVEHTPQQTAGYSDEDLIRIFVEGVKPANARFRVVNREGAVPDHIAANQYMRLHRWDVPALTQQGIVAYLRSLTPRAQGAVDFGGFLRGGQGSPGNRP